MASVVPLNPIPKRSLKNTAIDYARLGFWVIPITPKKKSPPLIRQWPKKATSDEGQIEQWWNQWPDANIAIVTGSQSGIFVLDIDEKNSGRESLRQLQIEHGALPATAKQATGNGEHYFFQYIDGIKNSVGRIGAGIDVRGYNGYVIAAPSIHPNGRSYRWEIDPDRIAPAPDWLLKLMRSDKPTGLLTGEILEGNRNSTLFREGCRFLKEGKSRFDAAAELMKLNYEQCNPPLPDDEVNLIISSINAYQTKGKKPLFKFRDFVRTEIPRHPALRHILHEVSFYMDVDGKPAYPTIAHIAAGTGYSTPTVGKWLKHAADHGYIIRKKHKPAGQRFGNYIYMLPKRFTQH